MNTPVLLSALVLTTLGAGQELTTRYEPERALRVSCETKLSTETRMEMLRDGEPVGGRGGGDGTSTETRRSVHVDRYLACADGKPARVRRTWEHAEGEAEMVFGDQTRGVTLESPFEDLTVEIARDEDGDLSHEVVEGSDPGQEGLDLLQPQLALDALLRAGELEEGDSWDLEPEAIAHALGLDIAEAMYRRPEPEGGEGRGGGGRGGRGGMRGGGGSAMGQLASAEWSGKATYTGQDDRGGVRCAVIAIELAAQSDLEGEGLSGSFEVELEGTLYVALEARRPVAFEVEGSVRSESDSEREGRDGGVIEMHRESEGSFTLTVTVETAPFEEE